MIEIDMKLIFLPLVLATAAHAQPPAQVRVVSAADFADDVRAPITAAHGVVESKAISTDLSWPLQPMSGFDQFDYHGVSNYVDHDARYPGFVQDYACGSRTYDLSSGYNHAGTDYFLWPYAWLMMDQAQVRIVAAAPGTISRKDDGHFDRSCALDGNADPNDVYVQQDDGLTAIYLHMRKGSLTPKPVGARVVAGEYLGLVGSSGNSTAPHLHFELRDANGVVVDPRHGTCNSAPDRWIVAQVYEDPHIDSLSTHSAEPQFVDCGVDSSGVAIDEIPSFKDAFAPGDELWVFASYRDQRNGEVTDFKIVRPDGSVFATWSFDLASQNNPKPFYSGTGADWNFQLPADAPGGTWTISADFQQQTYTKTFTVGVVAHALPIGGYLSGNWYDPAQNGSGFQIEVASGGVMVAIWFVFEPSGGAPTWIFAEGSYDPAASSVTLPATTFAGAAFPPSFRPADVTRTPWGTLTFSFTDCNHGTVSWTSTVPGYGSGSFDIVRLTQIDGTTCPA